ncbi:hypothetical protein F5880DRAFT_1705447 [Lentinula raphanica]|nr:hypothetical protein F5880DRAFT_1705447 [Lentinula raphanica]
MLRPKTPCQRVTVRYVSSITPKESSRIIHRRMEKAERDERMDLTTALTPPKTEKGGFTRPKDLRASNWFPGGPYVADGKAYEDPSPFAYEPHTVFLLESRYDIKYEVGRVDSPAHIVAVCRAGDFEAVLKMFNSRHSPSDCKQFMDNARWPWLNSKEAKFLKSSDGDVERPETIQDLGDSSAATVGQQAVQDALEQASRDNDDEELRAKKDFRRHLSQTAAVAARVSEEPQLSNIATDIKPLQGKIPFELEFEDGTVAHPSGFVPPTPADKQYDPEYHLSPHPHSRVATELRRRQVETVNEHHSDSLVPRIEQWQALKESKGREGGLMPTLTTGILSGDVSAATEPRDAKIPTEIHGVHNKAIVQPMQHASGFVPPTARMSRGETDARTSVVTRQSTISGETPDAPERPPTFASSDTHHLDEEKTVESLSSAAKHTQALSELREKYFEFIKNEPFWRPLIALTVSTRPIAKTLARLSRGLSQGEPFHSAVTPDDRKARISFASRIRSLRVTRMRTLAIEMAQLLAGARGGPIGVRFDEHSRGRGIDGEGLDQPIPWEKRVIGVGIGKWYSLADELVESFKVLAKKEVTEAYESGNNAAAKAPLIIYQFDDYGRPVGEVPEFPWLAMDKMNDEVRMGIQALVMVNKMEKLLSREPPSGKVLSVAIEHANSSSENQKLMNAISDHNNSVLIRFVDDSSLPAKGELRAGFARSALKKRIDSFYREHSDSIALAKTMHVSGVIYPHFEKDQTKAYLSSRETYKLGRASKDDFSNGNTEN